MIQAAVSCWKSGGGFCILINAMKNETDNRMKKDTIAIRASHIYKTYDETKAVQDLSFEVKEATCFGFLGPNGAGKTTTMKMLYGKAVPDRNHETSISVYGFDPRKEELSVKNLSGVVPQDDNLDVELNVEENLRIYARFYDMDRRQTEERIDYLLNFMELAEKRKAKIDDLSGGMKRRLLIARGLINRPALLILDEPTTGLDPQVRQLIWDKLRGLKKEGVTILLTTHYMEEAYQIADTVIIMDKGRKILEGDPRELLKREIEQYVLEIIASKDAQDRIQEENDHLRRESSEERLMFYSNDFEVLKRMSADLEPGQYFLRQTTLEDLFLKTTGRQLNAVQ